MAKKIITIARQYGSGGREIGRMLASMCGYEFYDNNLINMSAKKIGMDAGKLTEADEKVPNSILYTLAVGSSMYGSMINPNFQPVNDKLFLAQSEVIEEIAKQETGAVIVGRCADHVLEDRDDVLHVYLYADFENRVEEICRRHGISKSESKSLVMKTDKRRANYYNYYTGKKWGKMENYDLSISTDGKTHEEICEMIKLFAGIK